MKNLQRELTGKYQDEGINAKMIEHTFHLVQLLAADQERIY